MTVFPLLAKREGYRACTTDLLVHKQAREHWLHVYATHTDVQIEASAQIGVDEQTRRHARSRWLKTIGELEADPAKHGTLDILQLERLRRGVLHAHGIVDEFRPLKQRENEAALAALPRRLAALDAITDDQERLVELMRGVLAGNLFDMGADATASSYTTGTVAFEDTLVQVPARPWHYDGVEAAEAQLRSGAIHKAIIFADNAGADVVLGLLPLAREMLGRGISVVVTANAKPAQNDITHEELIHLRGRAAEIDAAFASPRLHLVSSGNDSPLIDLGRVSEELASLSADADLVVLIGMGRALESNFNARFTCASWKLAMVKDEQVARSLGAVLFDAVVKVEPAAAD